MFTDVGYTGHWICEPLKCRVDEPWVVFEAGHGLSIAFIKFSKRPETQERVRISLASWPPRNAFSEKTALPFVDPEISQMSVAHKPGKREDGESRDSLIQFYKHKMSTGHCQTLSLS